MAPTVITLLKPRREGRTSSPRQVGVAHEAKPGSGRPHRQVDGRKPEHHCRQEWLWMLLCSRRSSRAARIFERAEVMNSAVSTPACRP